MILYKAIKYFILDLCIERMFSGLSSNLVRCKFREITAKELKKGMKFKRMELDTYWWNDCEIKRVDITWGDENEYRYNITIKSRESSSECAGFEIDDYPIVVYE